MYNSVQRVYNVMPRDDDAVHVCAVPGAILLTAAAAAVAAAAVPEIIRRALQLAPGAAGARAVVVVGGSVAAPWTRAWPENDGIAIDDDSDIANHIQVAAVAFAAARELALAAVITDTAAAFADDNLGQARRTLGRLAERAVAAGALAGHSARVYISLGSGSCDGGPRPTVLLLRTTGPLAPGEAWRLATTGLEQVTALAGYAQVLIAITRDAVYYANQPRAATAADVVAAAAALESIRDVDALTAVVSFVPGTPPNVWLTGADAGAGADADANVGALAYNVRRMEVNLVPGSNALAYMRAVLGCIAGHPA